MADQRQLAIDVELIEAIEDGIPGSHRFRQQTIGALVR
jgi:hypothetical protein